MRNSRKKIKKFKINLNNFNRVNLHKDATATKMIQRKPLKMT